MGSLDDEIHASKRRKTGVDLIDRLSNLPDHILQHILSSLDLKDRAQTSALGKQWRYIWLGSRNLRVDQAQFVEDDDRKSVRSRKMKKFKKVIDRVMSDDTSLDTLDISITVAVDSNTLNLWILRAMRRSVRRITLSISKENYGPFQFPATLPLCTAFKKLTLESLFEVKAIPICRHLEELSLLKTYFGEEPDLLLELSGFCGLQKVKLEDVHDAVNLTVVSPNLKSLTIHGALNLEKLRIETPSISEFVFRRWADLGEAEFLEPQLLHLEYRMNHTPVSKWSRCTIINCNSVLSFVN